MTAVPARMKSLDFVKGICILLVVLVHSVDTSAFPSFFSQLINAVFLNCFFIVSGMLVATNSATVEGSLKKLILKRFRSLIVPYLFFSVLAIVWHIFLCVGLGCTEVSDTFFGWMVVLRDIFTMVSGLGIGTLWFLPVLFLTYSMLLFTIQATNRKKSQPAVMAFLIIISLLLSTFFSSSNLDLFFSGMLSKVVSEYTLMLHRIAYGYAFSLLGFLLYSVYACAKSNIYLWGILLLTVIMFTTGSCESLAAVGACSFLVLGSMVLLEKDNLPSIVRFLDHFLMYCGKHSLAITIFHYIFLLPIEIMILKAMGFPGYGWLTFFINLSSTLFIVRLLENNRPAQFFLTGNIKFLSKESTHV